MSRHEADREDLLSEATALVHRAELRIEGFAEPIVIGFRRDGAATVFVGQDPVFQFNSAGQLRRGYVGGRLLKADRGRLAALTRQRQMDAVVLLRHDLDDTETAAFLALAEQTLSRIRGQLAEGRFKLLGEVPADGESVARIRRWLGELPASLKIATSPRAGRTA